MSLGDDSHPTLSADSELNTSDRRDYYNQSEDDMQDNFGLSSAEVNGSDGTTEDLVPQFDDECNGLDDVGAMAVREFQSTEGNTVS